MVILTALHLPDLRSRPCTSAWEATLSVPRVPEKLKQSLDGTLGRYVLVFCCDETFDVVAVSRIFVGLCQVGAWGCFDGFNRLAEQQLSAVSERF